MAAELDSSYMIGSKPLFSLRVIDLKTELEKRGLSKSGTKKDLQERLRRQIQLERLQESSIYNADQVPNLSLQDDAIGSQNEVVKQYLAEQQKTYAIQKEARRQIELSADEVGPSDTEASSSQDEGLTPKKEPLRSLRKIRPNSRINYGIEEDSLNLESKKGTSASDLRKHQSADQKPIALETRQQKIEDNENVKRKSRSNSSSVAVESSNKNILVEETTNKVADIENEIKIKKEKQEVVNSPEKKQSVVPGHLKVEKLEIALESKSVVAAVDVKIDISEDLKINKSEIMVKELKIEKTEDLRKTKSEGVKKDQKEAILTIKGETSAEVSLKTEQVVLKENQKELKVIKGEITGVSMENKPTEKSEDSKRSKESVKNIKDAKEEKVEQKEPVKMEKDEKIGEGPQNLTKDSKLENQNNAKLSSSKKPQEDQGSDEIKLYPSSVETNKEGVQDKTSSLIPCKEKANMVHEPKPLDEVSTPVDSTEITAIKLKEPSSPKTEKVDSPETAMDLSSTNNEHSTKIADVQKDKDDNQAEDLNGASKKPVIDEEYKSKTSKQTNKGGRGHVKKSVSRGARERSSSSDSSSSSSTNSRSSSPVHKAPNKKSESSPEKSSSEDEKRKSKRRNASSFKGIKAESIEIPKEKPVATKRTRKWNESSSEPSSNDERRKITRNMIKADSEILEISEKVEDLSDTKDVIDLHDKKDVIDLHDKKDVIELHDKKDVIELHDKKDSIDVVGKKIVISLHDKKEVIDRKKGKLDVTDEHLKKDIIELDDKKDVIDLHIRDEIMEVSDADKDIQNISSTVEETKSDSKENDSPLLEKTVEAKKITNRKISVSGSKEKEDTGSESKPQRRRKWGSISKAVPKSTPSISTESLKDLIPDIKSSLPTITMTEEIISKFSTIKDSSSSHDIDLSENKHNTLGRHETKVKKIENMTSIEPLVIQPPSPARNPVSNIIHVRNLVRPFTLQQLKEVLGKTGTLVVDGFWIDKIKSKCYVTYETEEQATETRESLHGSRWPTSNPKMLLVDFSTVDELNFHKDAGKSIPPIKLEHSKINENSIEKAGRPSDSSFSVDRPRHTSASNEPKEERLTSKKPHDRDRGKGNGNELGFAGASQPVREWDRDKLMQDDSGRNQRGWKDRRPNREHDDAARNRDKKEKKERREPKKKQEEETPGKLLDDLFKKTKGIPCIYWLPLTEVQIVQRDEQRKIRSVEREKRRQRMDQEEKVREETERKLRQKERETRLIRDRPTNRRSRSVSRSRSPVRRR